MKGRGDITVVANNPISYTFKEKLVWKILCCCAVEGFVTIDEILYDTITNQTEEEGNERAGNIIENYFGIENDAIGNKGK